MKSRKAVFPWICLGIVGFVFLVGQRAAQDFRPPRLAVVDITRIFEDYDKKSDRQKFLNGQSEKLEKDWEDLRGQLKDLESEMKLLQPGKQLSEKKLEHSRLKIEAEDFQRTTLKNLRREYFEFLREIRDEITKEIEIYADSTDLDVIVEKTVTGAETEKSGTGFKWPIIHFAKPEIEITSIILHRLNERYRENR